MFDDAGDRGEGSDGATDGFEGLRFADDIPGDAIGAAEVAELRRIRAGLIEQARVIAGAEAERLRLLARAAEIAHARMERGSRASLSNQMELRSIAAELAMAVRENDRTMQSRLGDAEQMMRLFPTTVDALQDGRISRAHATAIADTGCGIDDPAARAAFEQVVLENAMSETPARTRAFARGLADRVDPRSIDERHAQASLERRVTVTEVDDGMARLEALLPVVEAFGILDRLTQGAKAIEQADAAVRRDHAAAVAGAERDADVDCAVWFDERSRDQIRADLLTDLLLTGLPSIDPSLDRSAGGIGAIRAHVQLTVPVTTLTGTTTGGAELNGRSPVDSATARRLAGGAPGWDRVLTHPVTGTVLEVDRYTPTASQQRFLNARDVRCRHPGCRQPALRCQLDHNDERQHGGATHLSNLSNLCVRHHTMKTETGWTVQQLPGGSLEWTSPLDFRYRDDPPPRVVFLPEEEEPPAPF